MNKRNIFIALAGGLTVLVGAVWFFFIRSDAPPPASLEEAVAAVTEDTATEGTQAAGDQTTETTEAAQGQTTETTEAPATTAPPPAASEGLDGTWVVEQANSFAGYRIGEELANIGTVTAVGRTSNIEGNLIPVLNAMDPNRVLEGSQERARIAKSNEAPQVSKPATKGGARSKSGKGRNPTASLPIESLTNNQKTQAYRQSRSVAEWNTAQVAGDSQAPPKHPKSPHHDAAAPPLVPHQRSSSASRNRDAASSSSDADRGSPRTCKVMGPIS